MKNKSLLMTIAICIIALSSVAQETGTFTDSRDGKVNKTVIIGKQTWMAENLNVDKFLNGDPIPVAKTDDEWEKAGLEGRPICCNYGYNAANGGKYGKLYNWFAVNDKRGLAPKGYHIANDKEWQELFYFAGGIAGVYEAGKKLKGTNDWKTDSDHEIRGKGTNESGFNALPGGYAYPGGEGHSRGRGFNKIGEIGMWWSATKNKDSEAPKNYSISWYSYEVDISNNTKQWGFSVRCVKN